MGDVISGIGTAAADSIGYWAPARYRSNPNPSHTVYALVFTIFQQLQPISGMLSAYRATVLTSHHHHITR